MATRKPKSIKRMFSRYTGGKPLDQTNLDDIPRAEQEAFFAARGDTEGEMTEQDMDELYAAWLAAQRGP